ncbi:MAG: MerR family transcriptional regulator [Nitrospirota bacterium]
MNFNAKTVTKLTGLTYRRLDYWDRTHFLKPSTKEASGRGTVRLYSFTDIVQLKVAKSLSDKGVTLRSMRKAILYLKMHFLDIEKPLAEMRFITDGEKIFVLTKDGKAILDTLSKGQMVFTFAIGEIVKELKGSIERNSQSTRYKVTIKRRHYDVTMQQNSNTGEYIVKYPGQLECTERGKTREEALENIKAAIRSHLEKKRETRNRPRVRAL